HPVPGKTLHRPPDRAASRASAARPAPPGRPAHPARPARTRGLLMGLTGLAALLIVAVAVVLVVRGWDVRLVLLAAALLIAGTAGLTKTAHDWHHPLAAVVREFLATFSNEKFVVPICSAMGFAY